jgi:hypothetical protein
MHGGFTVAGIVSAFKSWQCAVRLTSQSLHHSDSVSKATLATSISVHGNLAKRYAVRGVVTTAVVYLLCVALLVPSCLHASLRFTVGFVGARRLNARH